jgi:2-polyprenyl-3-methyl-5-hydroxy-6-metoxy-1,4-benzoquinol methylase
MPKTFQIQLERKVSQSMFEGLLNLIFDRRNPHAFRIHQILWDRLDYSAARNPRLVEQCDQLFVDRWHKNRRAFRQSFWQGHFEMLDLHTSGFLTPTSRTLDFGCGTGSIDVELARRGHSITGIDLSPKAIQIAELFRQDLPVDTQLRLKFACVDIEEYKPDELFDRAIMLHVLEHITDPSHIFRAFHNVLLPQGSIWISVPFANYYDDPSHVYHFYAAHEFEEHLAQYCIVQKVWIDQLNHVIRAIVTLPAA